MTMTEKENGDDGGVSASSCSPPPFATLALALVVDEWANLGSTDTSNSSSSTNGGADAVAAAAALATAPTNDLEVLVDRATALLLVRCVAVVAPLGHFPDISTGNICRDVLMKKRRKWPSKLSAAVQAQLREFVKRMLSGYKEDVPYHNREHAFHVLHSTVRLMDCFLCTGSETNSKKIPVSYGLRHDPLALLALAFAALIHDVEHQGIPNRQLALEDDRLAILYNDQSIAENWSIYVAFSELLQDDFQDLREALFPNKDVYHRFRKIVINLVLCTDIASPERTQISKSKWKEAFGDPYETLERKMVAQARRMSLTGQVVGGGFSTPLGSSTHHRRMQRRGTGDVSEMSFDHDDALLMNGHDEDDEDEDDIDDVGDDEDASLSVTPDNSDHQDDDDDPHHPARPGAHLLAAASGLTSAGVGMVGTPNTAATATATTTPSTSNSDLARRYSRRRSSTATSATAKYRQRLGIMRTVDLSGETLINYVRSNSLGGVSILSSDQPFSVHLDDDEPNELKATVVMETIMAAADVAHNLQGWPQMCKFSSRLYLELRKAYCAGRGGDPEPRWFENQIGFLESYLLPLAHRLEDTGVFPEKVGESFAKIVERNRDKWLTHGFGVSQEIIEQGAKEYPLE